MAAHMVPFVHGGANMNLPNAAIDAIWLVRSHPTEFDGYDDAKLCAYLVKKFPTLQGSMSTPDVDTIYLNLGSTNDRVLRYEALGVMPKAQVLSKKQAMIAFMQQ